MNAWDLDWIIMPKKNENIITDLAEIIRLCKDININKSSCMGYISSDIFRDAFMVIPEKLIGLLNVSFRNAEIPKVWKTAKITPQQKPGNRGYVGNLHPVSFLPLPSKLIEKIAHNKLYNHCKNNTILDKRQGGFRPIQLNKLLLCF